MPGPADDPLSLDRQVFFPLYAATNLLQRAYRPVLEPLGLTYSQYLVMLLLWEHEPASVGELGERLHLEILVEDDPAFAQPLDPRSEEHTSELQSLMRISYAVFCLKKQIKHYNIQH